VVECHGTGTALGDPIEVNALAAVYGEGAGGAAAARLVKTQVGHLEAAAGLAGWRRCWRRCSGEALPPTLHTRPRSPHIEWDAAGRGGR
jgi:acyl transferase domain-containing protein